MRCAVVTSWRGGGALRDLTDDGAPAGPVHQVEDLTRAIAERERAAHPRWVWASTPAIYPSLVRESVRLESCHDLALTEALLLGHAGRWGEPRSLGAAWARSHGAPVPDDPPYRPRDRQPTLFDLDPTGLPEGVDPLGAVADVYADQVRRLSGLDHPERFRLLIAAESAGALAAAEMGHVGVPWRPDEHDRLLTDLLGARPAPGRRPAKLEALVEEIRDGFGARAVNPDSPADLLRAFARDGVRLTSTRAHELRDVEHPAVPALLEYKELARLAAAHGWAWLDAWVDGGRFRPEYLAGAVVSGRWATHGGGALQIPKVVRRAVVADPGWTLVVADAAQLEPRVLAALAGDNALAEVAGTGDLYTALGEGLYGGDRGRAKIALLAAMYGQTGGEAAALLGTLRRRFPRAIDYVERAARTGEAGGLVRSRLGRTCPPPSDRFRSLIAGPADPDEPGGFDHRRAGQAARDRGRFTRNFVVQATAAEWALILLATLRRELDGWPARTGAVPAGAPGPELVFFQHDEVVVHCPEPDAPAVVDALSRAAGTARRMVFGPTPVRFPLGVAVVDRYSDAK